MVSFFFIPFLFPFILFLFSFYALLFLLLQAPFSSLFFSGVRQEYSPIQSPGDMKRRNPKKS